MPKILLVDDDVELTELLSELLSLEGFDVEIAHNGQDALDKLDNSYHLVLLDIMMPVLNGIDTLKVIRQKYYSLPVLMLTARGDDIDRVLGLELGADDYLPKPFNDRELVARIKAVLRRTMTPSENLEDVESSILEERTMFELSGLTFYPGRQQVLYQEQDLELTGTEFALLMLLIKNAGQVLSKETLSLEALGKALAPFDRAIDMHMSNLRRKLPERPNEMPWFKTLRGRGYLFLSD